MTRNFGGCLPRRDEPGDIFPLYKQRFDVIPRSRWDDLIEEQADLEVEKLFQKTKDQGSEGTCTSNASGQGFEGIFVMQFGADEWVETSALSLYQRVASNPNSGSSLPDNLRELCQRGILPTDSPRNRERFKDSPYIKHFHANTGYYANPLPGKWEETAQYLRADEFADITSFDQLASAALQPMLFPIYGRASHAILGVRLVKRKGVYHIKYHNSWGDWGENGYGYDSEDFVTAGLRMYGAFCTPSVIVPPWYQMAL